MSDPYAGVWSVNDTTYRCSVCLDSGIKGFYYEAGNPHNPKYIPCDCAAVATQRKQVSGDLAQFAAKSFTTLERLPSVAPLIQCCEDYAANPTGWLVLLGGYGCGKSHCAAAIANASINAGCAAQFYAVPDLFDSLRETFNRGSSESFDERWQRIRSAPLLILDDIGTENLTDWAKEKRYQLVNYRYNTAMPTVFTTNVPMIRLAVSDGRIESRLSDTALVEHLDFTGIPDYRKLSRQQRKAA